VTNAEIAYSLDLNISFAFSESVVSSSSAANWLSIDDKIDVVDHIAQANTAIRATSKIAILRLILRLNVIDSPNRHGLDKRFSFTAT